MAIIKSSVPFIVLSSVLLSFAVIQLVRTKELTVSASDVIHSNYWTKKELWRASLNEIEKIKVSYLSETKTNTKHTVFYFNNGDKKKVKLLGILLDDFSKPFISKDIKVFYELNNKYERYRLPVYNKRQK